MNSYPYLEPKDPDQPKTYSLDWRRELVGELEREASYALTSVVRPHRSNGFYLECTKAGETDRQYPTIYPSKAGEVMRDGSAEFTARDPGEVSIPGISSAVWTLPAALTEASKQVDGSQTHITITGGVAGIDYEITCLMTPTSGNAAEQTVMIPVREL